MVNLLFVKGIIVGIHAALIIINEPDTLSFFCRLDIQLLICKTVIF